MQPKMTVKKDRPLSYVAKKNIENIKGKKAVAWWVENILGLTPETENYENAVRELVQNGETNFFIKAYLEHKNDTDWINSQRQHHEADKSVEARYDDMVLAAQMKKSQRLL